MQKHICQNIIDASLFTWYQNTEGQCEGVSECSTLGFRPGQFPAYMLWDDSVDVGLVLRNSKTDKEVIFILEKEIKGEKWIYSSYGRAVPIKLVILND